MKKTRLGQRKVDPSIIRDEYISGVLVRELRLKYHLGRMTIYRYIKEAGGLNLEDKITHWRNYQKREVKP